VPHIDLNENVPGIVSLFLFRPETALPIGELAEVLLRGPSSLSRGERELIGAYVSTLNDCHFCASSHSAFAAAQLPEGGELVGQVCAAPGSAPISTKLKALLRIAAAVQRGGKEVGEQHIDDARAEGATDVEIHDTVLIAAAFCMFNRYVDGLATIAPEDPAEYEASAEVIVNNGYLSLVTPPHPAST
jgi:uncharacterized peroxidase-related enzyme